MGLFTPAQKSNNEEKTLAYIEKCENQKKLAQIVRESKNGKERKNAALRKLKDQSELRDIAVDWNGPYDSDDYEVIFTDPEEIHDAYVLARESAKRYEIDRKPYEKLLNKLTYPDDIEQAIKEYKNYIGADNVEKFWGVEKSWVWQKLNNLNDQDHLLSIVKKCGNADHSVEGV